MSAAAPKRNSSVGAGTSGEPTASFPRSSRLLRHADFERVYKLGKRHFSPSMTFFYLLRNAVQRAGDNDAGAKKESETGGLRVGFTVGRALGGAVQRNRIKRRLREAVRLSRRPSGIAADVVINPKKSLLSCEFQAVLREVGRAFAAIEQKILGTGWTTERNAGRPKAEPVE